MHSFLSSKMVNVNKTGSFGTIFTVILTDNITTTVLVEINIYFITLDNHCEINILYYQYTMRNTTQNIPL